MVTGGVSACIVLYRTGNEIENVIKCLRASTVPVDLFLVDNSSDDPTSIRIRRDHQDIRIIKQNKNVGFGKGNNAVIPELRSRYHLILNADVTFPPDLVGRMVEFMDEHPEAVILTPRVLNENGTEQFLPKRQPTVRYLLSGLLDGKCELFTQIRREYTMADEVPDEPVAVHFATGCFLLIRTEVFRALRGFDERFFMYQEDSDLSRRAEDYGSVIYHPDMRIVHAWKRENARTFRGAARQIRSVCKFFRKWGIQW